MFGKYDVPLNIIQEGISVSIEKYGENFLYTRDCNGAKVEKTLLAGEGRILVNPVEPVYAPKKITQYFLIELEKALVIKPQTTKKIFLTFPVEIAVFISDNSSFEVLDIFSLAKQKYTLYGDPNDGLICKYWKSNVYGTIPSKKFLYEGIMELSVANSTSNWVEVTKAVFNAHGMKIYYNEKMVTMKADMKLRTEVNAETSFQDTPLESGMINSLEIYTARKLIVAFTKFIMEYGL